MIDQQLCPFCHRLATDACEHLALAVEGRDFVRTCIERCQGERPWQLLCQNRRERQRQAGEWAPEQEDFTWLETAFADAFLRKLHWFGGLEHEWRGGAKPDQAGFWVLMWSRDPQRLWWELREEFERQCHGPAARPDTSPWLIGPTPK